MAVVAVTTLSPSVVWSVVFGVAAVAFALRASFLLGIDRLGDLPPTVERVVPFVPIAVIAALTAPNVLVENGALAIGPDNPRFLAGIVGFAVAWVTENQMATVVVGMLALWAFLWL